MNAAPAYNIISLLLQSSKDNAGKVALRQGKASLTYSELIGHLKSYAAYFESKGLAKGDRVVVLVPMSIELYTIVLGLFYAGMTPVFVDEWVSAKRLAACCENVVCRALITKRKYILFTYLLPGIRKIPIKLTTGNVKGKGKETQCAVAPTDTALISFTTGSTGTPKAANRTHEFLFAQYDALKSLLLRQGDVILNTLPVVTLLNLGLGKTTVLPPLGFKATQASKLGTIIDHQNDIDSMITSPSIALTLSEHHPQDQVRHIITGGGPVTPEQAQIITNSFSRANTNIVYGSTEAEPISHIDARELAGVSPGIIEQLGLPVGRPGAIEVRIIEFKNDPVYTQTGSSFRAIQVAPGQPGEIVVSGAHVLKDYINNHDAVIANKINVEGTIWHRTGDAGRLDQHGNLYFLGRCSERIVINGLSVFPLIVSIVLNQRTGIGDAALLVINDRLTIFIESKSRDKAGEVAAVLKTIGINNPAFHFLQKLPRDPRHHTKIDYEKLRRMR